MVFFDFVFVLPFNPWCSLPCVIPTMDISLSPGLAMLWSSPPRSYAKIAMWSCRPCAAAAAARWPSPARLGTTWNDHQTDPNSNQRAKHGKELVFGEFEHFEPEDRVEYVELVWFFRSHRTGHWWTRRTMNCFRSFVQMSKYYAQHVAWRSSCVLNRS